MSYQQTVTIAASGAPEKRSLGSYAYVVIRDATVAAEVSFDGQVWQPAGRNDSFGPLSPPASDIYFRASGGAAGTVTFAFGLQKLVQQDTAQSNAKTFLLGNCGIATNSNVTTLPASDGSQQVIPCDASGYLSIPNNFNILVPGTNGAKRRQMILFGVSSLSPMGLNIQDSNQCAVMTIAPGQQVVLSTDSDLYMSGAGGIAKATVGQIFLSV